jgi:hypothetical protein
MLSASQLTSRAFAPIKDQYIQLRYFWFRRLRRPHDPRSVPAHYKVDPDRALCLLVLVRILLFQVPVCSSIRKVDGGF